MSLIWILPNKSLGFPCVTNSFCSHLSDINPILLTFLCHFVLGFFFLDKNIAAAVKKFFFY